MKRSSVPSLLFCFLCSLLPLAHAEDASLSIQATTDQTSVKTGMMFLVHARVVNTNDDTSTGFWGNTCSYEKHWVTDNPDVLIQSWTCAENSLEEITLSPGDVYEKNLILYIPQQDKTEPVTFRMGFKRMSENGDIDEPLWSDPVTMKVIVPEAKGEAGADDAAETPSDEKGSDDLLDSDEPAGAEPAAEVGDEAEASDGSKGSLPSESEAVTPAVSGEPLVFQDPGVPIEVQPGDEFSIALASNPSTGFRWKMTLPEGAQPVIFLGSQHVVEDTVMPGVPGTEVFKFKAAAEGEVQAAFVYERPWETITAPTRKIFTILVEEN